MKSIPKLMRRCMELLLISGVLILFLNISLLILLGSYNTSTQSPWTTASQAGAALQKTEQGYSLPDDISASLARQNIWAVFIDDTTRQVMWHTENLPDNVPMQYTLSDISDLSLGYLNTSPTFPAKADGGLIILGYSEHSYWKPPRTSIDYQLIRHTPQMLLIVLSCNVILILAIYVSVNTKFFKSVNPIVEGVQTLSAGEQVHVREDGLLSEIAVNINRTSDVLQSQKRMLKKKETARANWIAGVSHDIRTPLSMVMGYAGQLENDENLTKAERAKAAVITRQSEKMKNLINDLNLASKLEYNMQPLQSKPENVTALVRQVAADFMNMDIDSKYPISLDTGELNTCMLYADKDLLKRAVTNLIQNSINHNENGCSIYVSISAKQGRCHILVEDDGIGTDDEELYKLNNAPHYMVCDGQIAGQRHGLGLLIVRQIAAVHGGTVEMRHSRYGGFAAAMILPIS